MQHVRFATSVWFDCGEEQTAEDDPGSRGRGGKQRARKVGQVPDDDGPVPADDTRPGNTTFYHPQTTKIIFTINIAL